MYIAVKHTHTHTQTRSQSLKTLIHVPPNNACTLLFGKHWLSLSLHLTGEYPKERVHWKSRLRSYTGRAGWKTWTLD